MGEGGETMKQNEDALGVAESLIRGARQLLQRHGVAKVAIVRVRDGETFQIKSVGVNLESGHVTLWVEAKK